MLDLGWKIIASKVKHKGHLKLILIKYYHNINQKANKFTFITANYTELPDAKMSWITDEISFKVHHLFPSRKSLFTMKLIFYFQTAPGIKWNI